MDDASEGTLCRVTETRNKHAAACGADAGMPLVLEKMSPK